MSALDACTLDYPSRPSAYPETTRAAPHYHDPAWQRRRQSRQVANQVLRQRLRHTHQSFLHYDEHFQHCTFLDPFPIVLAGNKNGINVIRVNDNLTAAKRDSIYITTPSSRRNISSDEAVSGIVLARCIDSRRDAASASAPNIERDIQRIQSIRGGHAFAVGTSDGQFRVFSTETATEQWASQQTDWSKGQVIRRQGNIHAAKAHDWMTDMTVWQSSFPVRRFRRNLSFSLQQQILSPGSLRVSDLAEFVDWPAVTPSRRVAFQPRAHRLWDFWDNGSSLLAAHVGREGDYFTIRLQDDRCRGSHVVVDKQSTCVFHDKTICFTSDKTLVTYNSKEEIALISVWDIRFMQTALPSSVVLPSFPRDSVVSQGAVQEWRVNLPMEYDWGHDITALPDGQILWWLSPTHWHIVNPILSNSHQQQPLHPTTKRQALPSHCENFVPAFTNRPTHAFAALSGSDIVRVEWESLVSENNADMFEPRSRKRSRGPMTADADANDIDDDFEGGMCQTRICLKHNCSGQPEDPLAMNEDGTMFLCGSARDETLFLVQAGLR